MSVQHLLAALLVLTLIDPIFAQFGEGSQPTIAEIKGTSILIGTSNGETKRIAFEKLSVEDQMRVLDLLSQMHASAVKRDTNFPGGEQAKNREFDEAFVKELNDHLRGNSRQGKVSPERLRHLLGELEKNLGEANQFATLLLELEDTRARRTGVSWGSASYRPLRLSSARQSGLLSRVNRDLVRLLAGIATVNPDVTRHFEDLVSKTDSSPEPNVRMRSALRLYGAENMARITVPALINCMESDPSTGVQLAAATALGSYSASAEEIMPVLLRAFANSSEQDRELLAWPISELDPKAPVVSRFLRECFQAYNSKREWLFDFVESHPEQAAISIRQLLAAAERAEQFWRASSSSSSSRFHRITGLILSSQSDDPRILKYYRRKSPKRPEKISVYCDSIAKRIEAQKQNPPLE